MRARTAAFIAVTISVLGCASTVESPSRVPDDVARFVERRQNCDHFRGEEAYSPERRAQLEAATEKYCRGTDRELAVLRAKYGNDMAVLKQLNAYEGEIEGK